MNVFSSLSGNFADMIEARSHLWGKLTASAGRAHLLALPVERSDTAVGPSCGRKAPKTPPPSPLARGPDLGEWICRHDRI